MKQLLIVLIIFAQVTLNAQTMPDSGIMNKPVVQKNDSLGALASLPGLPQAQKIRIIKKEIDFPTTIKLALSMMGFIALMFFSTQSWNPGGINE